MVSFSFAIWLPITFARIHCSVVSSVKQQNSCFYPTRFFFFAERCGRAEKFLFVCSVFHICCSKLMKIYSFSFEPNFSGFRGRDGIVTSRIGTGSSLRIPTRSGSPSFHPVPRLVLVPGVLLSAQMFGLSRLFVRWHKPVFALFTGVRKVWSQLLCIKLCTSV